MSLDNPSPLYLDGGGDPDFAQIDAFLHTHFNARAVYVSDLAAEQLRVRHETLVTALRDIHYSIPSERRWHPDGYITDYGCAECGVAWPCATEAALRGETA
jgi:hypothetical protein